MADINLMIESIQSIVYQTLIKMPTEVDLDRICANFVLTKTEKKLLKSFPLKISHKCVSQL